MEPQNPQQTKFANKKKENIHLQLRIYIEWVECIRKKETRVVFLQFALVYIQLSNMQVTISNHFMYMADVSIHRWLLMAEVSIVPNYKEIKIWTGLKVVWILSVRPYVLNGTVCILIRTINICICIRVTKVEYLL